jgi:hypothetical protein
MTARVEEFHRKEFWLELNPELSISDIPLRHIEGDVARVSEHEVKNQLEGVTREGYFLFPEAVGGDECQALAAAVERLVGAGIPTPFLWVYDEAWQLFARAATPIAGIVGPNFLVGGDLWVWHVSPEPEAEGWGPHRDANLGDELLPDGRPAVVTVWFALTEATPDNGCMYVLPMDRDPHVPDALGERTIADGDIASVRALPVPPGSLMGWNTRLLHWGARSSARAASARISVSMYAQRCDAERLTLDMIDPFSSVPLHHRLGVVSRALLTYGGSGLSGTTISDPIVAFATEQQDRLRKWLAMTAELRDGATEGAEASKHARVFEPPTL